jgi:hypothetical protein
MRKTVAVDLDGVLARYEGYKGALVIGEPLPGAVDFVKELLTFADVVVHTSRVSPDEQANGAGFAQAGSIIRDWLKRHGFPEVRVWDQWGKPIASAYVDDRAVLCQPQSPSSTPAYEYLLASSQCRCLVEET